MRRKIERVAVEPGQVRYDPDPRCRGRKLKVERVENQYVYGKCGTRATRILVSAVERWPLTLESR